MFAVNAGLPGSQHGNVNTNDMHTGAQTNQGVRVPSTFPGYADHVDSRPGRLTANPLFTNTVEYDRSTTKCSRHYSREQRTNR